MIYDIQKASVLKRISAFLLDFILICIVAVGVLWLLSMAVNLDADIEVVNTITEEVMAQTEAQYGVSYEDIEKYLAMTQDEQNQLTEQQRQNYQAAIEFANNQLAENETYSEAFFNVYTKLLMCLSLGLFAAYMLLEFVLPLILKNGQTVGMKVFGLGVVFNNSVRVNTFAMFVRAILGKFTLETMLPVLMLFMLFFNMIGIVGVVVIAGLAILQIVLLAATKNRTLIHDIISNTVIVDISSQMIFDNYDDLVSYKEEIAKEKAEKATY